MFSKNVIVSLVVALTIILAGIFYFDLQKYWLPEKQVVTVAVSQTPLSSPFYVAKAIGAFDNTCVRVDFLEVKGGQVAFSHVMKNRADFATTSDAVLAFQSIGQYDFVNHAMFVQSDNDVKLLTRREDNIEQVNQLKGKKVGVIKGSASEYLLSDLLAIEGMMSSDVEIAYYPTAKLTEALLAKEVDAALPWEPFVYQALKTHPLALKVHDTKSLYTLSFNLVSKQADVKQVKKARCLLQGLQQAINYINGNEKQAKKIVLNALGLEPDFIDWVWSDYVFRLALNQSLLLSIKSQAVWALESRAQTASQFRPIEQFIDSRALLHVDPSAVNLASPSGAP